VNQRYQLIVFDWDGTLMDSEARIVTCLQAAAADLALPVPDDEAARDIIGLGLQQAVSRLFGEQDEDSVQRIADAYRVHFLGETVAPSTLFPRARAVLERLLEAELMLAVATGKSRRGLDMELERTGLGDVFHYTRCADETFSKPHPQMMLDILDYLGMEPAQSLMVGDTEYDMQMARGARTDAVGVSYGVHRPERLLQHGALHCLDTIDELPVWLARDNDGG
jgi:phosphoglycolate phosphatase